MNWLERWRGEVLVFTIFLGLIILSVFAKELWGSLN